MPDFRPSSLPVIGTTQPNGMSQPSTEDTTAQLPSAPLLEGTRVLGLESDSVTPSGSSPLRDIDPQIIEALRGKDRIYVLKLGELMEGLIHDERRQRIELTPATSYQRLLVHRCSAYYKLVPEADPVGKGIFVYSRSESRIPIQRISELVPAETTAQPAFKIMRRISTDRRYKTPHQTGSVTGEDGDLSDLEPSETGSQGGRSNTTGGSTKKHMTIEEREAAYNEARSRIFMGFEEKDRPKDKDINSSSSSPSVTSGSTKNGGSSAGDADSSSSSPATESEWSGPVRRERLHNSGNASASSSTRSIRSTAYVSGGSGSSRNSRAPSPSSFQYASLYEPAPSMPLYDPAQHQAPPGPMYHPPYGFPYNQGQPNPPFMPYPYFPPPYPQYASHPLPQQNVSDPSTSSNGEPYPPHPPQMSYAPPYMWPHPGHPGQPSVQSPHMQPHTLPAQPPPNAPHPMGPPPGQPPYQPYMQPAAHPFSYPVPGYYPGQPGHPMPPPPPPAPHLSGPHLYDHRSSNNAPGNGQVNGVRGGPGGSGIPPSPSNRPMPRSNPNPATNGNCPRPRNGTTQPTRAPWSYGPGVGSGGYVAPGSHPNETVGPRLSHTRRQNNLSSSSTNGRSTSGDEVSSTASSSSSPSRKPQTPTAGSQHPLPARPDWAINLKPHNSRNMTPISPPRSLSGGVGQPNFPRHPSHSNPSIPLQSTDFPPLTSMQPSERRTAGPSGAWGNPPVRPLLSQMNSGPNNDGIYNGMDNRLEEAGFERPPPKFSELYNPKLPKRGPINAHNVEIPMSHSDRDNDNAEEEATPTSIPVDQVAVLSLNDATL